eukprot:363205-Chlamydomonas_euryale.AAC.15
MVLHQLCAGGRLPRVQCTAGARRRQSRAEHAQPVVGIVLEVGQPPSSVVKVAKRSKRLQCVAASRCSCRASATWRGFQPVAGM